MQTEAPGQTRGPAGVPLPLSSDEDDEAMDFSNSRKRLREESGDEDNHAPRKQTVTTHSESSEKESHTSQGSEELSGSECRTTVDCEVASTTADMPSSATTGGIDPASSDAAIKVVEEVLHSTAAGGNTRKQAPYTAKDFLLKLSAGATPTNRRKKKPTKKQPPVTASEGTAANLPQPFGKAPTAVDTTRHSSAEGSPPDTEGFQVVTTRGARRRARDLAADAALPVDPAIVGTVLFRPSAPGGTFSGSPRLILSQALYARPGVAAIRVNQKRNNVAADATTREFLEQLLTIKELKGIPVTAKEPADHKTSTGFLHGVNGEPAVDSLLPGIQSAVPVLSAAREKRTVTLRFACPVHRSTCHSSWHASQCGRPDPAPCNAGNAVGSAMSRRAAAGQAAASDVAGPTRERAANRPDPGVSTAGAHTLQTPRSAPGGRSSGRLPLSWCSASLRRSSRKKKLPFGPRGGCSAIIIKKPNQFEN
ncbi:hypothetical protein HPB51_005122 [Rhipicephalus microplus]|uniref:Uncharacterized protein n=1 Tax=Rhipicephalus microplus TaxID=6941 RepID=A0A9J6EM28_RHIMP|nr:hypothetical protein HPB51_005122 [Rhipicephalus microplus]